MISGWELILDKVDYVNDLAIYVNAGVRYHTYIFDKHPLWLDAIENIHQMNDKLVANVIRVFRGVRFRHALAGWGGHYAVNWTQAETAIYDFGFDALLGDVSANDWNFGR